MTTKKILTRKNRRPTDIKRIYFNWLCRRTEKQGEAPKYEEFISDLHRWEFYSILPNDDNRGADGTQLRNRFANELNLDDFELSSLSGPCTILEMLVALAERMDFQLYDTEVGEERYETWFWIFIKNLDLNKYSWDDPEYETKQKRLLNKEIIRRFVERGYDENGKGGLFPLKYPEKNQKKVEIWYQMMYYISENY